MALTTTVAGRQQGASEHHFLWGEYLRRAAAARRLLGDTDTDKHQWMAEADLGLFPVADCHRHLVFGGVRGVGAHGVLGHGRGGRHRLVLGGRNLEQLYLTFDFATEMLRTDS